MILAILSFSVKNSLRVFLPVKALIAQLLKKLLAVYGNRRFNDMFARLRHCPLSSAK
jgi:hypothetical protein